MGKNVQQRSPAGPDPSMLQFNINALTSRSPDQPSIVFHSVFHCLPFCTPVFQVWSAAWLPTVWTQNRMLERGLVLWVMGMVTTPISSALLCCFSTWRIWRSSCTMHMRAAPMRSLPHQRCANKSSRLYCWLKIGSKLRQSRRVPRNTFWISGINIGSDWQPHLFSNGIGVCINHIMNSSHSVS